VFLFSTGGREHYILQSVRISSRAQPPSYSMDSGGSFPTDKEAKVWRWPLTST